MADQDKKYKKDRFVTEAQALLNDMQTRIVQIAVKDEVPPEMVADIINKADWLRLIASKALDL